MSISFFIAQRYFRQGGSRSLIHRIGFISFLSVALSTLALLLVLSVFNGLEGFVRTLFRSFDPDIKIVLKHGKTFQRDEKLFQRIAALDGVDKVIEVIEDNALLRYQNRQVVIKLKGVSKTFLKQSRLAPFITQGELKLTQGIEDCAMLGAGVQYTLSVPLSGSLQRLKIFYPRPLSQSGAMLPGQLYRSKYITPIGVFAVEKHFDERYVIAPIEFVAQVMNYQNRRTALEIQVKNGFPIDQVQQAILSCMPAEFNVLNSEEQQASLMQAIYIERIFVFATFSFILFIASLNIFFILSMIALEKRREISVLYTLGATSWDIRCVFLFEGLLIALSGAAVGIVGAGILGWLQQRFGIVSLGASTSLIEAYPVEMHVDDFLYTGISIVLITLLAAWHPAQLATKTSVIIDQEE